MGNRTPTSSMPWRRNTILLWALRITIFRLPATHSIYIAGIASIIYSLFNALVVQWIERLTPNELIEVRFLSGAPLKSRRVSATIEWHVCKAVRWLSGRRRRTRNAVYLKGYRGFKSHPHRFACEGYCLLRNPIIFAIFSCGGATLAQLVEQCFRKAKVPGSNPGGGSEK